MKAARDKITSDLRIPLLGNMNVLMVLEESIIIPIFIFIFRQRPQVGVGSQVK